MIRAGLLSVLMAAPAAAEGLVGQALCSAVWAQISDELARVASPGGNLAAMEDDWCVVEAPVIDLDGQYVPDWHAERLRFRGAALAWAVEGAGSPDRLEIAVENLRLVVQTGNAQMDYLFAAQSRPNTIDAEIALGWDSAGRILQLETLTIDFPGENLVEFSARAKGVDLSTAGAAQMSATSFALTEADLRIRTHGLFEWYVLMSVGPSFLPTEGDMEAAAAALRAEMTAALADLPEPSFSPASKAALSALIAELPNPSGVLTLSLRSEVGMGPTRLAGYAANGLPDTVSEARQVFEGTTVDIGWTHEDAP
jgi:hypothetical protein